MLSNNFCKCNNCGNILFDQNPQIDAKEYEPSEYPDAIDMVFIRKEMFWACPECLTDEYLTDL